MTALVIIISILIFLFFIGCLIVGVYLKDNDEYIKWNKCPDCGVWNDDKCNCDQCYW